MDAQRFDNLAKSLAGRLTRRNALRRAGAAASATLLASAGVRSAPAVAQGQDEPVYTVIRRYTLDNPTNAVRAALQRGYIEAACAARGFIAYFTVEDEDGDFATVAVFRSQDDFETFATAEANWIAQNLENLLPAPDEALSGDTYVYAGAGNCSNNRSRRPDPRAADPDARSAVMHGSGMRLLHRHATTMRPGPHLLPDQRRPRWSRYLPDAGRLLPEPVRREWWRLRSQLWSGRCLSQLLLQLLQ
jgi:hypothetical protein